MRCMVRTLSSENLFVEERVDAVDEADLRRQLAARGLPEHCASFEKTGRQGRTGSRRRGKFSLVLLSQELLALLSAGLSVVECLEALHEKEAGLQSRHILATLLSGLRDGRRLSSVLADNPALFPPLFVGIVRAAENTSDLPQALQRYIHFQERVDRVRDKLVAAAIYPCILAVVGGAVCLFLIGYVVPRFAEVYQGAGRDLPWLSALLLECGRFVAARGPLLALGSLCVTVIAWRTLRTQSARVRMVGWCDRLPGIGAHLRIVRLSRMYFTLGMLLEGGISILTAIDTVRHASSVALADRLQGARDMIATGQALSHAFEVQGLATPISMRLLRVGERSGELGRMLTQSASFYDEEILRRTDRFMRMFEPLLMAVIGIVVGAIVVLLYMPIFDLAGGLT